MQTVAEWVSSHCQHGTIEFDDQIRTYANKKIVKEIDGTVMGFPQRTKKYKNVYNWVLLEDGTSVGWNESPSRGWSFHRSGKEITETYIEFFKTKGLWND